MSESWRPIRDFETYEVSTVGRVRNTATGRVLKPWNVDGYRMVGLRNGSRKCCLVHRLVAESFIGTIPDDRVVCHRNDIRHDNRLENLYIGTRAENTADAYRNGRYAGTFCDPNRTHCKNGHQIAEAGVYVSSAGVKSCKSCYRGVYASRRREKV